MLVDLALVPVNPVNRITASRKPQPFGRGEKPRLSLYQQIKLVDEVRIHTLFIPLVDDEADEVYFDGLRKFEQNIEGLVGGPGRGGINTLPIVVDMIADGHLTRFSGILGRRLI